MTEKKFIDIPLSHFGINFTIKGMLLTDKNGESIVIVLPDEDIVQPNKISLVRADMDEWDRMINQLDTLAVEAIRGHKKVILRKSQRNIDGRISWQVFKRDGYKCRYCGEDDKPLTVDHIITWENGGATHPNNLLTACSKCNKKRGNMSYEEWLNTEYYISVSQNLTEEIRLANTKIIAALDTLPKVVNKRSR